jgi:hydroxymethylbilane synthase
MTKKQLCIATRESPLALWQAEYVRSQLLKHWPFLSITLLPMRTSGDQFLPEKGAAQGGKGLFVKELEEALLDKRADLAVHSMKDVPAECPDGLFIAAICGRENPFDAFVSPQYAHFQDLPKGALVGTSSLRRQSQLLALRPDLCIKTLRGNIHTRLNKLDMGEYHAIILAATGLERLGMADRISEVFSEEDMLPACGQGALGIECRKEDEAVKTYVEAINHASSVCVKAEREVNALLGGNCQVPLAVFCKSIEENRLQIQAKILSPDGQKVIHALETGPQTQACDLAKLCAQTLLAQGGASLLKSGY